MIQQTLHQIWNQRRGNLWIWLELAVLSAFLWIVLDPLFTMVCLKSVPTGFDRDRIYFIEPTFAFRGYKAGKLQDAADFAPTLNNLLTQLQNHPRVEAVSLTDVNMMPGGRSSLLNMYYHSAEDEKAHRGDNSYATYAQTFSIPVITGLEKWCDVLYTLGVRDAASGAYLHVRPDALAQKLTYVSAGMADRLYGTTDAKDSMIYDLEKGEQEVDGVYANVKEYDCEVPFPSVFRLVESDDDPLYGLGILVRLKEGTDGEQFMMDVQHDVLKPFCTGLFKKFEVTSLEQQMDMASEYMGANNVVRLQAALGFFGLLCVFLGVSGLFWVRCGERRQDIGVMRSKGASRRTVKCQMLLEGTLLLTASFWVAMLFVAWYVRANGYNMGLEEAAPDWMEPDMAYWFNRPWPHVLAVTLLTYALMLLITLLGTWVPVHRATRISPCDALRDE